MKKLYGSNSAFMQGNLCVTQYNSGCLRSILLGANGVRDQIDPKHIERGALFEEQYAAEHPDLEREKVIAHTLVPGPDGVVYSSRCDFFVGDDDRAKRRVVELKSSESKSVLTDVIKKGKVKMNNLAQLVSYMVSLETVNGTLIYAYYERDKKDPKVLIKRAERSFDVKIGDDGSINVDHQPTEFNIRDQLDHRYAACRVLSENIVWSRPYGWQEWSSPCRMCPFQKTCNKFDMFADSMTAEEFIEDAKTNFQRNVSK